VRGLSKRFGRSVALDSVNFDLPAGSVLGLLGLNGSGKTTLIRLLLGLARPDAGTVELLGQSMPAGAGVALPQVGALVAEPGFQPHLTGWANLTRLAKAEPLLGNSEVEESVAAALRRVNLQEWGQRRCREYTPGMRQRLGLAVVLLAPRRLVILDEPTSGLDPAGIRLVRELIGELRAGGSTVLVASHQLGEIERACTHLAVLAGGAVVAEGELNELLDAGGRSLEVATPQPDAALAALRHARVASYLEAGRVIVDLRIGAAPDVLGTLVRAGVPVTEARTRRMGLEELFIELTEESS
jgi:ABC-2 type transport system ATP-binding protein